MKKVFLVCFIFAIGASINAQTIEKKWGFGAAQGAYTSISEGGVGLMPEFYFSRYLSPKLDLMFKPELGLFNSKLTTNDLDLGNLTLNLRYKISDETKKLRPYLFAGPGYLQDNQNHGLNFNLGFGSKYYVTQGIAFYAEAGYINEIVVNTWRGRDISATNNDNFIKATFGMEFDFGRMKDTDMDGITDKKDNCPSTPAGVDVDENGCPVDTDGDGIADYIDKCPNIEGLASMKGCPDTDKDGITDADDNCPEVAGLKNLKGCPDTDGDGIADKDDKCANTLKGYKVDATGCPIDSDKDGIVDAEDECPTVAGPADNKGCPVPVKEVRKEIDKTQEVTIDQVEIQNIKVKAVHFVSRHSYLTDYSKGVLAKLVKLLNSNPDYNVNAHGYTDSQGSDQTNFKLSTDRIKSVIEYLVSQGISENRIIQQKAFGKANPIATNETPEGRLLNRRVEFEIFKMK